MRGKQDKESGKTHFRAASLRLRGEAGNPLSIGGKKGQVASLKHIITEKIGGKITEKTMAKQIGGIESTTSHTEVIGGRKYIVVSHYVGSKDFKKVLGDLAFKQVLADMQGSAE